MKSLLRALGLLLLALLSIVLLAVLILGVLNQQWMLALVALFLLLGAVPLRWSGAPQRLALLVGLGCCILFLETILDQGEARLQALAAQARDQGAASLRPQELAGIYALGLVMAVAGKAAGYGEAADEHFMLYQQGPAERAMAGDFPLEAPQVRAALRGFLRKPAAKDARGGASRVLAETTVPIPYLAATRRYALALNPVRLSAKADRGGVLEVIARVACRYEPRSNIPLFAAAGKTYHFDEGVFYALQERGWLHPYTAVWHMTLREDDARLK